MNLITLENISKSYSEKILLDNISLGINDGDKIGLIGINGAGKSTLLKIIGGREEFFEGNISKVRNMRIEYLSQTQDFSEGATVLEQVFKGDTVEMKLLMEYEDILKYIEEGQIEKYQDSLIYIQGQIEALNLWDLESEAKIILNKLGITNYHEKVMNLSGGQKKRVALASALITPCELLILDEPTNHLDSDSIEWLEDYLNSRKGALIMITHDRYFLDRVTNRIMELDRGSLYSYQGNYSEFLEKKVERLEREKTEEDKRASLIREELKWVKRGAKARTTKQKARLQRFDDLVNYEYIEPRGNVELSLVGTRLGNKGVELTDINKAFGDKVLIKDFSYNFVKGDRVGIVGNNGMGKTTLINIISGKLSQDSGEIDMGETVKIGCFSQDSLNMDENMRVIDYVKEGGEIIPVANGFKITASQMCERFLFDGTMQYTPIGKLSGGERRRLQLLRVLMEAPNVLILDEPTNDLDIDTLQILENFLDDFGGILLIVSHDRYFLDRLCHKIFAYEGSGKIKEYTGNFSDYLIKRELSNTEVQDPKSSDKETKKERVKNKDERPKFSFKEQKEYEQIDEVIEEIENKISKVEKDIESTVTDYEKLQKFIKEKEELELELAEKYERWEYLNELAQRIEEYNSNK
ncbi:ABC-F family ATP-binding cassette domain-containing protein [Clostridium intestinale]|uniref:ABC-F family ATP-binding cassette domain-containing protein n=1 Tax=Clostridium intestinale TaxID=36845 RepID=A0A7D7A2S8_9CLOT|nr:ABC-F family ATP-binding cassette domain-containing protein [Clostridium intestinale]QLY79060.1 ABC-F family ATP-binding cassette domain-containing protein [Clostridium intestinale]